MNKKPFTASKGQALPYFIMMMVVLILCWAMLVNVAKLVKDRMMLQNAADNAALSVATYKARTLNMLGQLNCVMASALYGTKYGCLAYYKYGVTLSVEGAPISAPVPVFAMGGLIPNYDPPGWFAVDDQQKIAGVTDMLARNGNEYVSCISGLVKGIVSTQEGLMSPWQANLPIQRFAMDIGQRQEKNAAGELTGADLVFVRKGISLGLERNENWVKYYKTKRVTGLTAILLKATIKVLLSMAGIPGEIKNIYKADYWKKEKKSWLYADRDNFYKNCKITVIATKYSNSDSNRGYPLMGRWFGIQWPTIMTVASASVYNTKGPMFPVERRGSPSNKISPVIRAYENAKDGGWDAHLVPVREFGLIH